MKVSALVDDLLRAIDDAVESADAATVCARVKSALQTLARGAPCLDEELLRPAANGYGRRLLHRDPQRRYTVVVMSWGPGQGTPIHDHSGMWCVECVYRGRILVRSFQLCEQLDDARVRFALEDEVSCGIGAAGALIPPFDYHVIENRHPEPAATIHVYGGEMELCEVFLPDADGLHRRESRPLSYTGA